MQVHALCIPSTEQDPEANGRDPSISLTRNIHAGTACVSAANMAEPCNILCSTTGIAGRVWLSQASVLVVFATLGQCFVIVVLQTGSHAHSPVRRRSAPLN